MGQVSLQEERRLAITQRSGFVAQGPFSLHPTEKVTGGRWLLP